MLRGKIMSDGQDRLQVEQIKIQQELNTNLTFLEQKLNACNLKKRGICKKC